MKECIGALAATAALLIASVAFARQEKSVPYKYQGGAPVYADLAKAPEKARAKRNPFEKDPEAVDAGRNLFEQHCSECHGNAGDGSRKAPSLRAEEVQSAAPGAIFWIKLPEPQRWQLVSFIKSLGSPSANSRDKKSP